MPSGIDSKTTVFQEYKVDFERLRFNYLQGLFITNQETFSFKLLFMYFLILINTSVVILFV